MSKLPILMYHKVSATASSGLTISAERLEEQFQFLVKKGYQTYHFSELSQLQSLPKKKNMVLTFDDGYVSQLEFAVPLLKKYGLKATFFIPLKYIGKEDQWNQKSEPIMDAHTLKTLDPSVIELAYHSYAHQKFNELSPDQIEADTQKAFATASEHALPLGPYVAYPFGKYPRKNPEKAQFFQQLKNHQFTYGLRIGNRLNTFPFDEPFEIQRIDVKGDWGLKKFRRKIKFGKWV